MGLQYTDALRRAIVASLLTATTETATFTSGTATLPAGVKGDAAAHLLDRQCGAKKK